MCMKTKGVFLKTILELKTSGIPTIWAKDLWQVQYISWQGLDTGIKV